MARFARRDESMESAESEPKFSLATESDASEEYATESEEDEEAEGCPKGSPTGRRIAYLDNLKFMCMCSVWWSSGIYVVSHYCGGDDDDFPASPVWAERLGKMLEKYSMPVFAVCSGAVSHRDASPERVANLFASLILPCVLFQLWYSFVWYLPATGGTNSWGTLFTNKEPWYVKTLFAWRIMLFCLGQFSELPLLAIAVVARLAWVVSDSEAAGEWTGPITLLSHALCDGPFFVLGHILARRWALLEPYTKFLRRHSWVQVACLLGYIALWVDALMFGQLDRFSTSFFGLFQKEDAEEYSLVATAACKDVFKMLEVIAYGFLATGWLPTRKISFVSSTGKQTIYAYLQMHFSLIVFLSLWKKIVPHVSESLWWATWLMALPFFTMILCSEPVRFILWPIARPTWFPKAETLQSTRLSELTDVKWVRKAGFLKWSLAELVFHGAWIGALMIWGLPWEENCDTKV